MTQDVLTQEQIELAVGMLMDMHALNTEKATVYRDQYIEVIVLFITGVSALLAFYITQKRRRYLTGIVAGLVVIMTVFTLAFQLYWYKYTTIAAEWSFEYRQEAVRVIRGEKKVLFATSPCPEGANNGKPLTWRQRKSIEHEADWISLSDEETKQIVDACERMDETLYSRQQMNIWLLIIVTTCGLALLTTYRLRRGVEDV